MTALGTNSPFAALQRVPDKEWFVQFLERWANSKSNRDLRAETAALGEQIAQLRKDDWEDVRARPESSSMRAIGKLAREYYVAGNLVRAAEMWRHSTSLLMRAYRTPLTSQQGPLHTYGILRLERSGRDEHARWGEHFAGLIAALYNSSPASDAETLNETFQLAQWSLDLNSGLPIAQMAARSSNPRLAALQKERDDLVLKFHDREGMNCADTRPLEVRIEALNKQIETEFPGASTSIAPEPLTIAQVQSSIGDNEAVALIVDGIPGGDDSFWLDEVFVWVITKADARWTKAAMSVQDLARHTLSLRCGLDASAWETVDCASLLELQPPRDADSNIIWDGLPYDLVRANDIYNALLKPMEDLITGKHLFVVPSAYLSKVPLHRW